MENTYTEHWKPTSLYLSLYKMYVGMFVNSILDLSEYSNEQEENIKKNHENIWHLMEEINFS